jgi:hypothetical protein
MTASRSRRARELPIVQARRRPVRIADLHLLDHLQDRHAMALLKQPTDSRQRFTVGAIVGMDQDQDPRGRFFGCAVGPLATP